MNDRAFKQPFFIQSGDGEITPLIVHTEFTTRYEVSANNATACCEYEMVNDLPASVAVDPTVDCRISTPGPTPSSCFAAMMQAIGVEQ